MVLEVRSKKGIIWRQVIISKYGVQPYGDLGQVRGSYSISPWKGTIENFQVYKVAELLGGQVVWRLFSFEGVSFSVFIGSKSSHFSGTLHGNWARESCLAAHLYKTSVRLGDPGYSCPTGKDWNQSCWAKSEGKESCGKQTQVGFLAWNHAWRSWTTPHLSRFLERQPPWERSRWLMCQGRKAPISQMFAAFGIGMENQFLTFFCIAPSHGRFGLGSVGTWYSLDPPSRHIYSPPFHLQG